MWWGAKIARIASLTLHQTLVADIVEIKSGSGGPSEHRSTEHRSNDQRSRRGSTNKRPTHFNGELILRKTLEETPEERLIRKKQETRILAHKQEEKEKKNTEAAAVKKKEKEEFEASRVLIEVPNEKWKSLVRRRLAKRVGFHCLFLTITSDFSDEGVHSIISYFQVDDKKKISPFEK